MLERSSAAAIAWPLISDKTWTATFHEEAVFFHSESLISFFVHIQTFMSKRIFLIATNVLSIFGRAVLPLKIRTDGKGALVLDKNPQKSRGCHRYI
jgi:hypothetical protein